MSVTALVFVVLYFGLLLAALVKRPFFGLCAYLLAYYLHPPVRWWGESLPDLRWSLTAALVTLVSIIFKGGRLEPFRFPETRLYLFFLLFVGIQSIWALNVRIHLEFLETVFSFLMLIYLLQSAVRDRNDLIGFVIITMMGCSYFTYVGMNSSWGGRMEGVGGPSIGSANQMAQHVAAVACCGAYLLLQKGRRWWAYGAVLILLGLCLKAILMAGSRGVYLAIAMTAVFVMFQSPVGSRKRLYVLSAAGFVLAAVFLGPTLLHRFEGVSLTQLGEAEDQSARSRVVILEAQFEMFKKAPLLGHGHKGTLLLSPGYIPLEYLSKGGLGNAAGRASHNYFMSLLVDHGLIGASIVLVIIARCLMPFRRLSKMPLEGDADRLRLLLMGLMSGLVCLMIAGMSSDHKNSETSIWFFALIPLFMEKLKHMVEKDVA